MIPLGPGDVTGRKAIDRHMRPYRWVDDESGELGRLHACRLSQLQCAEVVLEQRRSGHATRSHSEMTLSITSGGKLYPLDAAAVFRRPSWGTALTSSQPDEQAMFGGLSTNNDRSALRRQVTRE